MILVILNMLEITQGSIVINNLDLSHTSQDQLASAFSIIPQEPYFVPGSIRENAILSTSVSDSDIQTAFEKVGLWKFVLCHGGLDSDFEEDDLSIGQKQLFYMVRAMLSNSKIVIMDEPTSR